MGDSIMAEMRLSTNDIKRILDQEISRLFNSNKLIEGRLVCYMDTVEYSVDLHIDNGAEPQVEPPF